MIADEARFNPADLSYLIDALAALDAAAEVSNVAAVRGTDAEVRALARWTLAAQCRLLGAVKACLEERSRPTTGDLHVGGLQHRLPATVELSTLDGAALDRSFVELLTTHISTSMRRARAEMVNGLDADVRRIAEETITKHSHELAAIARLAMPAPATSRP